MSKIEQIHSSKQRIDKCHRIILNALIFTQKFWKIISTMTWKFCGLVSLKIIVLPIIWTLSSILTTDRARSGLQLLALNAGNLLVFVNEPSSVEMGCIGRIFRNESEKLYLGTETGKMEPPVYLQQHIKKNKEKMRYKSTSMLDNQKFRKNYSGSLIVVNKWAVMSTEQWFLTTLRNFRINR